MEDKKLTQSKKAQFGAAFTVLILGLISQGLPIAIAAYLITGVTALEIIAWTFQDRSK